MFVPCILYRISTQEIINFNYSVSDEFLPPQGLDPDLQCLAKYEPFPQPELDARVFKLVITNEVTNVNHPIYPAVKAYKITYSEERRTKEEMKLAVDNAWFYANQSVYAFYDSDNFQSKSIAILYKKSEGQALEVWETEFLELISNMTAKIQNNDSVKAQKYAAIDANQIVDTDLGWEFGI